MIAPMLCGVVYCSTLDDYVRLLADCNVKRVFAYSFWARVFRGLTPAELECEDVKPNVEYIDCHCLAALSSFSNAFKLVVVGDVVSEMTNEDLIANRKRVSVAFLGRWKPYHDSKGKLLAGQVVDDKPPRSVWIPIEDFIKGVLPAGFPVVDYPKLEGSPFAENN